MKTKKTTKLTILLSVITAFAATAWAQNNGEIPDHPKKLDYPQLEYAPPKVADHRHVLSNGVVAFLVEDHDLPLVDIDVLIRVGDYLDPEGKTGLAAATGSVLRAGGTLRWNADEFDEEADFLAASLSSFVGSTSGSAGVNALSKDLDRALELCFEMLRNPAFQQDRIDLYKSQVLQRMERRNDSTTSIESREWDRLMRGDDHFTVRPPTQATIEAIGREDLIEFHRQYYHPDNFIFAVAGDFDTAAMKQKLEAAMADWPGRGKSPAIPEPGTTPTAGVYMVNKEDVNQGRVSIGHLGIRMGNPDEFAIDIMNDILGGSGFTSRITNRVRSDEGLAYSAGSIFTEGAYYPGIFRARFQSRSPTCARAASIVIEEIERMRTERVTEEELETVKTLRIEIFPRYFASASAVAQTFARGELIGRPEDYLDKLRDNFRAVTADDVLRVAKQYLMPDKLVILAVGNVDEMLKGDADKPEFSFQKLAAEGSIKRIPLPDPMTMVYPEQ